MISGGKVKVPHDLLSFLKTEDNFFIATHINPEGDALGSSIALSMALESLGKKTLATTATLCPIFTGFCPVRINSYIRCRGLTPLHSTFFCSTAIPLTGPELKEVEFRSSCVIDHHETEKEFGHIKWVAPDAAATGMMIFYLIKESGLANHKGDRCEPLCRNCNRYRHFQIRQHDCRSLESRRRTHGSRRKSRTGIKQPLRNVDRQTVSLLIMVLNTLEIREKVAFTSVTRRMFNRQTECGGYGKFFQISENDKECHDIRIFPADGPTMTGK